MNTFERKVTLRVFGIHVGVILFFVMTSGLKGCFRKKEKPEIVTFIEFGAPAPMVQPQAVESMPDPTPPEPTPVEPEPAPPEPEPIPAPIPEPVKKPLPKPTPTPKPKPKPVEKVKPKEPEKPKWKPTPVDQIKVSKKRIEPEKPPLSSKEIQQALQGIQSPSAKTTSGPVGNPDAISAYDAHIYSQFYNAWERPSAPGARPAKVTISISSSGRVTSSRLSQSSGDAAFDASVMAAVRRVTSLAKPPPTGYPRDNIIVQFRLID